MLHLSNLFFLAFNLGCSLATTSTGLIVCRFFGLSSRLAQPTFIIHRKNMQLALEVVLLCLLEEHL